MVWMVRVKSSFDVDILPGLVVGRNQNLCLVAQCDGLQGCLAFPPLFYE